MTSSVAARTAANRPPVRGPSPAWRSSTSDIVWRVTSPPWPHPANSSWVSSGNVAAKAGALALRFTCVFHHCAATAVTPAEP